MIPSLYASGGGGGHGGGGEAEGGAAAPAPMPKEEKEFIDKTGKLNSVTSRINESEKKFAELVHHKSLAKTPQEKQHVVQEMMELTKERNKDVETYNQLKSELAMRYPNRGQAINRRYQTQSKRTVEEMEGAAGLDEILSHTKKAIDRKFAPIMVEYKEEPKPKPAHVPEEKKTRLRLEK